MAHHISILKFILVQAILFSPFHRLVCGSTNPISFSEENIFIKFDPPPLPEREEYSEEELIPGVNKTYERFSNLFCFLTCNEHDGLHDLARAAAQFNSKLNDSNVVNKTRPMTVLYMAEFAYCGEKTEIDISLNLAREANSIHPGTVEYIVISGLLKFDALEKVKATRNQLNLETSKYKLGIIYDLLYCNDVNQFISIIKPLLLSLDSIILYKHSDIAEYTEGVEYTTRLFHNEFAACEKRIREISKSIEIGLATRWSSFGVNGELNFTNQVEFWREVNEWAIANNTKMFLDEAFDDTTGFDIKTETGFGWWKQVPNENNDGYEFKDKEMLAIEQEELARKESASGSKNLGLYIGVPVGLFVVVACFSLIAYYKRRSSTQLFSELELQTYEKALKESGITFNKIAQDDFQISENSCLGSGEFGFVCRGTIAQEDSENVDVAVKMMRQPCIIALRSLLSELRILAEIGNHSNVIRLVGACTEDVARNKLFIFLELCENGTLEKYLRGIEKLNENIGKQLLRWSYEISCGMEHVSSKNIVHMDIATRNILLSSCLTAKISDFGLSRRLYNYQMYTKKNEEPLPWRWMAPEALQKLQFTEKSDVWSFGVTLWEIFSLGSLPYAGILWDPNFFRVLEAGLRLQKPNFNPQNIYNDVIRPCWELCTDERPTFYQLKSMLEMRCDTEAEFESLHSNDIGMVRGWVDFEEPGQSFVGYTSFANLS